MSEYQLFLAFERGDYINLEDLPKITDYICGHLISWSPNRNYFESQYNYVNKLCVVGNRKVDCLSVLKKEKQYVMENLQMFLKMNNIENVVAQLFKS